MENKLKFLDLYSKSGKDIALSDLYHFEINDEYINDSIMKYHEIMRFSYRLFNRLYDCKNILEEIDVATINPTLYDFALRRCRIMLNVVKIYQRKLSDNYPATDFNNKINELSLFYDKLFKDLEVLNNE